MDQNVVDCELAERDLGMCVCKGGLTLEILKDIQRLYEEKMELIEKVGGSGKLQMQVDVLRSWVGDLVGQNTLLARAVEELETEATTKLLMERRKNSEVVSELRAECAALRRRLARKDSDLRGLVELLRRLREFDSCNLDDIHFFEVTQSDILGSVEWRQKKLEQGDLGKPRGTLRPNRFKNSRHYRRSSRSICEKVSELKLLNESLHKENISKDREIRQLNKDAQSYEQTIMNLRKEMSNCKYHTPNVSKKDAEVMAGMCCTGTECGEWEPVKDFSELLRDETLKYQERIQKMENNLESSSDSVRALRKVNVRMSEEIHAMRRVCAALDEQCRVANARAHFKDDIIKEMRRQLKQAKAKASTSFDAVTSTPNTSSLHLCARATSAPDVSVIERCTSAPILVSDASIADLTRHFKKCTPGKSASNSSCSHRDSSRDSPKRCIKKMTSGRCVQIQAPDCNDKAACVEELYFNDEAKRSSRGSSPRVQCCKPECPGKREMKIGCSSMTKIEKEMVNRSCGKNVRDSGGTCSLDSASATCDLTERAQYYHNKLLSAEKILRNKEETIRVQAESLSVAEARISALSDRANDLKRELDRKTKEYQSFLKTANFCKPQKNDVSVITDKQLEDQKNIVSTLQNNLCVIEDLYRECFYETAKQENLIDMLRSAFHDVRLTDRQKADKIGRLQTVINNQKWSLDRYQDIGLEVDNLKMEISNFLHSSTSTNNDSGMWERSEDSFASAPGVHEDLQDLTELLLRLQDLLNTECTCGLQEENRQLKEQINTLEIKMGELRGKACELECTLAKKQNNDVQYISQIEAKEKELLHVKEQLLALEEGSRGRTSTCDALTTELRNMKALLDEKTAEVGQVQQQNDAHTKTIKDLQEELEKADQMIKENGKMRSEVSYLTQQVSLWRAQLQDSERRVLALEAELARTRQHCTDLDGCYREKASAVAQLQANLNEAHSNSMALCGESRHAVTAVRHWLRRLRDKLREKDNLIKAKDELLTALQRRLEERQSDSQCTSVSGNTPSCSKCLSSRDERSCCSKVTSRRDQSRGPSTSELPSCSNTPIPLRVLRKKPCTNKRCKAWMCDAAMQEPIRRDATNDMSDIPPYCQHRDVRAVRAVRVRLDRPPRDLSPTEELFRRVEQLSEALEERHRRWTRPHDER